MFGFMAAFALAGVATAAWPIYLHLRKRHTKRVQVVPSLRLFEKRLARTRRRRIHQLILLLSRVGLLVSLFLLVSQPYLDSGRELPLPRISSASDADRFVGAIIDDSLSAFHGRRAGGRLEASRAWLLEQIDRLPEGIGISVVTSSHPQPTGFLTKEEARSLLRKLRVIPKRGNAAEALSRMADFLSERRGALLVSAPRESTLWPFGVAEGRAPIVRRLFFHDTSEHRTDCAVYRATRSKAQEGGDLWLCKLDGDPESLAGRELQVRDRKGEVVHRREITVHEALRKEALVDAEGLSERGCELSIDPGAGPRHPWLGYYVARGGRPAATDRLVVFRAQGDESLLAARVLDAIFRALRPEIARVFVTCGDPALEEIPEARAAVFVGADAPSARVLSWLEARIEAGVHVLCFPSGGGGRASGSGSWPHLPSWGPRIRLRSREMTPLRVDVAELRTSHSFDDILLGELRGLAAGTLREPLFAGGARAVITTGSGRALLAMARLGSRSTVWAFGLPVTLEDGSLVFHPAFPLLLDWILFPAPHGGVASGGSALVGRSADALEWFGRDVSAADLVTPSGRILRLRGAPWLELSEAGIYELRVNGGSELRAANYPRCAGGALLARQNWNEAAPVSETVWLERGEFLDSAKLDGFPATPSDESEERYDLSAGAAALLVLFLLLEAVFLARCWWWPTTSRC